MNSAYALRRHIPVAALGEDARSEFLRRTYLHLLGAILGFTAVEALLFTSGLAVPIAAAMLGTSWLLVLGGFVVVGWIASHVAHRTTSLGAQYAALAGFVLAEAVMFIPLLLLAQLTGPGVIQSAALVTLVGFGALTAVVFATRADLSFLGGLLRWAFIVALVLILAGVVFGFQLGTFFSVAMVALAGGAVLYDTSNVLHRYPEDRYVAAALEAVLFRRPYVLVRAAAVPLVEGLKAEPARHGGSKGGATQRPLLNKMSRHRTRAAEPGTSWSELGVGRPGTVTH